VGWSLDIDKIQIRDEHQPDDPGIYVLSLSGRLDTVLVLPITGPMTQNLLAMSRDCRKYAAAVTEGTSDLWMAEDFDPDLGRNRTSNNEVGVAAKLKVPPHHSLLRTPRKFVSHMRPPKVPYYNKLQKLAKPLPRIDD